MFRLPEWVPGFGRPRGWQPLPALEELLPSDELDRIVLQRTDEYRNAVPFPHIVIDGLLPARALEQVISEFPSVKKGKWHRTHKSREIKLSIEDETRLGPVTRQVLSALNSSQFVSFLERLTGIEGLLADPHYRGGGLHQILPGGKLGIHADFNFYPRLKVYRRLNVLVYLNRNWQEAWGGHLELWDHKTNSRVKRIAPLFNRLVLFDTSARSLHGHPEPLSCPEGHSRKSLALYYYTVDYPYQEDLAPHSTIFYDPESPQGKPA